MVDIERITEEQEIQNEEEDVAKSEEKAKRLVSKCFYK